jgi:hypothetical protein
VFATVASGARRFIGQKLVGYVAGDREFWRK